MFDNAKNVLGTALQICSTTPLTGFYRNGYCNSANGDFANHIVAAVLTQEFLDYTKSKGNDLSTPLPEYGFPGLKPGDHWCLCAMRWKQAMLDNMAPKIRLQATHEKLLQFIPLETLKNYEYTPWGG